MPASHATGRRLEAANDPDVAKGECACITDARCGVESGGFERDAFERQPGVAVGLFERFAQVGCAVATRDTPRRNQKARRNGCKAIAVTNLHCSARGHVVFSPKGSRNRPCGQSSKSDDGGQYVDRRTCGLSFLHGQLFICTWAADAWRRLSVSRGHDSRRASASMTVSYEGVSRRA
ncbi:hypothetical protein BZM26_18420 [Paraburkholderia strydomiana]|nr:hypothetical protein BZM26_18420 [Paraburkholderia strydomiana]